MSIIKTIFRPFYYLLNNGKKVKLNGYDHLKNCQWIINERFGMAYYKGYYEPEICAYLLKNIKQDSVFVDVGAHAGYFSLFAVKLATKGQVHSFEPEPTNFNYIQSIKQLNSIDNWQVHQNGVGSENATLYFSSGDSSTTGTIGSKGDFAVKVVTLDETLAHIPKINIMKIDVEGFGGRVLEGARKIIEKNKPIILFEVHEGSDELEVLLGMLQNDYTLTDMDSGLQLSKDSKPHFIICEPK